MAQRVLKRLLFYLTGALFICVLSVKANDDLQSASYLRGLDAYRVGNYSAALEAWNLSAFEGNAEAQYNLGVLYVEGKGVQTDVEKAHYWFLLAAGKQHAQAQYNLGHLYMRGIGVGKDPKEAMNWWRIASDNGYPSAAYNLGRAYLQGADGKVNHDEALRWLKLAADQGDPSALELLAMKPDEAVTQKKAESTTETETPTKQIEKAVAEPKARFKRNITRKPVLEPVAKAEDETLPVKQTVQSVEQLQQTSAAENVVTEEIAEDLIPDTQTTEEAVDSSPLFIRTPDTLVKVYTDATDEAVLWMQLNPGALLRIQDNGRGRVKVQRPLGFPVWVKQSKINFAENVVIAVSQTLAYHLTPNTKAAGSIAAGTMVSLLGEQGDWFKVLSPSSVHGWVDKADLEFARASDGLEAEWTNQVERRQRLQSFKPKVKQVLRANQRVEKPADASEKGVSESESKSNSTFLVEDLSPSLNEVANNDVDVVNSPNINNNAWLFSQPAGSKVLMLFTLKNAEHATQIANSSRFVSRSSLFSTQIKGTTWFYLLLGPYANDHLAQAAKNALPRRFQTESRIRSLDVLATKRCVKRSELSESQARELSVYCVN